jgi:hypothetical protein
LQRARRLRLSDEGVAREGGKREEGGSTMEERVRREGEGGEKGGEREQRGERRDQPRRDAETS